MRLGKIKSVVLALGLSCAGVAAAGSALLGDVDPSTLSRYSVSDSVTCVGNDACVTDAPRVYFEFFDEHGNSCYSSYVDYKKIKTDDIPDKCTEGGGVATVTVKASTTSGNALYDNSPITLTVNEIEGEDDAPTFIMLHAVVDKSPTWAPDGAFMTQGTIKVDSSLSVIH